MSTELFGVNKSILIISCVFPPEPVVSAKLSYDIAYELAKNHKVKVLSPKPTRPHGYDFNENSSPEKEVETFHHMELDSYTSSESKIFQRFYESYSFGLKCAQYIRKNASTIDLVYLNSWPLASQYLITNICKKLAIPTVTHIQDIYPETLINKLPFLKDLFYQILLPLDKYIINQSTEVITISNGMKGYLEKTRNTDPNKVSVVYNWQSSVEKFELYKRKKNDMFTMTFLGSLSPSANIEGVITAFGNLNNKKSKLVIAGSGSEKEKLERIAHSFPEANIIFQSAPSHKVMEIQNHADILLLPLRKGVGKLALPSKLIAYMFTQKPILAFVEKESDTAKIILHANCGWVVESEESEDLTLKMKALLELDKKILIEKGENSYNFAKNELSRTSNIAKIMKIINKY